ncbi:hypothetical protein OE88DRAFT_1646340 [Heliocybe sulcata]|uniref:Uncharacterized protein n=1 Tax=Heliocybe sulcata TaxID=5364 RepID=A0A5C3MW93_9AGAM|nr:hypothetical protein OE88DRAFT_1646340 [Heliocybe sulcata]
MGTSSREKARTPDATSASSAPVAQPPELRRVSYEALSDEVDTASTRYSERNKGGIYVSWEDGTLDFGLVETSQAIEGMPQLRTVTIRRVRPDALVHLKSVQLQSSSKVIGEHFTVYPPSDLGTALWVSSSIPLLLPVQLHATHEGRFSDTLELNFWDVMRQRDFAITRRVHAIIGSKDDHQQLKPRTPYVRSRDCTTLPPSALLAPTGEPPAWLDANCNTLGFHIPRGLKGIALAPGGIEAVRKIMPPSIDISTYGTWFQSLMWVNEERASVRIPGLLAKQPEVTVGDVIVVTRVHEGISWHVRVEEIDYDVVEVTMPSDFNLYNGSVFDIAFRLNHLPYRRMHEAVVSTPRPERLLFPKAEPGSGKTTVLVQAVRQLLLRSQTSRVLMCTPNNRAADTLTLKLMQAGLTPEVLLRLNVVSRPIEDLLSEDLKLFCRVKNDDLFCKASVEELLDYRVVVSTCVSGGIISNLGVEKGHFSHIFTDEAGQCIEPESMIPILSLADSNTNVVLAGDPRQLGPSSVSGELLGQAHENGHIRCSIGKNITLVVLSVQIKLRCQYRAHPDIFAFSNEEFYGGELMNCADTSVTQRFLDSNILATPGYPVVFHGINGKEYREGGSPSYFNIDEASLVKSYCAMLEKEHAELTAVLLTMNTLQVQMMLESSRHILLSGAKILETLPEKFKNAKVGTVDDFQGQERLVMILSTVRSNTRHINDDLKHSLGFVANPRHTNVALARARALLIVIGDPAVLCLDPTWRKSLTLVHFKGGARGQPMPTMTGHDEGAAAGENDGPTADYNDERVRRIQAKIMRHEGCEGVLAASDLDPNSDSDSEPDSDTEGYSPRSVQVLDVLSGHSASSRR